MPEKYYWIKERNNPQFKSPYYIAYGQITVAQARRMENPIYGYNSMLRFENKEQYEKKLAELRKKGFLVR